jgi:hypothetical protein
VSRHKIPLFDVLTGDAAPYAGFGPILADSTERDVTVGKLEAEALVSVREVFAIAAASPRELIGALEHSIAEMWETGWNPRVGNVSLFATDFGLILTGCIRNLLGGKLVFRSESNLIHLSLWWPERTLEAFPFHKMHKRLTSRDGESISFFARGLEDLLSRRKGGGESGHATEGSRGT